MNNLLCENLLAISFILNLWLLVYSMPKVKREVDYWKRRSTWSERYVKELEEEIAERKQPQDPPK